MTTENYNPTIFCRECLIPKKDQLKLPICNVCKDRRAPRIPRAPYRGGQSGGKPFLSRGYQGKPR